MKPAVQQHVLSQSKTKPNDFFCFLFPNFKNSTPWHNDTLRSFSTAISKCYIRPPKLILGLLTSARLSSLVPGIRAEPLFLVCFPPCPFLAHIYLCLPLILFKRAICTSRHGSPENYTCCMCHQSCRPREGVKRAVTEIWTLCPEKT